MPKVMQKTPSPERSLSKTAESRAMNRAALRAFAGDMHGRLREVRINMSMNMSMYICTDMLMHTRAGQNAAAPGGKCAPAMPQVMQKTSSPERPLSRHRLLFTLGRLRTMFVNMSMNICMDMLMRTRAGQNAAASGGGCAPAMSSVMQKTSSPKRPLSRHRLLLTCGRLRAMFMIFPCVSSGDMLMRKRAGQNAAVAGGKCAPAMSSVMQKTSSPKRPLSRHRLPLTLGWLACPGAAIAADLSSLAESLWSLLLAAAKTEITRNLPWLLGLGALAALLFLGMCIRLYRSRRRLRVPERDHSPEPGPVTERGQIPDHGRIPERARMPERAHRSEPVTERGQIPDHERIPERAHIPGESRELGRDADFQAASNDAFRAAEASAQKGAAAVHNAITGLDNTAKQLRAIAERIHQLGAGAQRITTLGEQLREVGEQADILALNAAVQAARSGESGRGLALAAEEAQKLAANSVRVIEEIAGLSRRMKRSAEQALSETEATAGDAAAGATLALDAARALGEIESASRDFLEMHELRR
ncbi:MAG: methyl-accepting chemotaxis protein [Gammaproteobacteria bacterium]